jgi:hypothetical protein
MDEVAAIRIALAFRNHTRLGHVSPLEDRRARLYWRSSFAARTLKTRPSIPLGLYLQSMTTSH